MRQKNTNGNPVGEMKWDFVSREKKRARRKEIAKRRRKARKG